MHRNITNEITDLSRFLFELKSEKDINCFFTDILTQTELKTLSKRWRILKMLINGETQRDIAQELQVSLCKVTRGSKILKNKNSVITKNLIKENKNGN